MAGTLDAGQRIKRQAGIHFGGDAARHNIQNLAAKGNQQQVAGFSQAGMRVVGDDTVEQRPIGRLLDSLQNQGRIGCCIGRAIRAHRFKIACVGHYGCALAQGVKLSSHVCY